MPGQTAFTQIWSWSYQRWWSSSLSWRLCSSIVDNYDDGDDENYDDDEDNDDDGDNDNNDDDGNDYLDNGDNDDDDNDYLDNGDNDDDDNDYLDNDDNDDDDNWSPPVCVHQVAVPLVDFAMSVRIWDDYWLLSRIQVVSHFDYTCFSCKHNTVALLIYYGSPKLYQSMKYHNAIIR